MGPVCGEDFAIFLISFLTAYPDIDKNIFDYCFLMDNARIHRANNIKSLLTNLNIIYNAPYTPEFNSIERIFS